MLSTDLVVMTADGCSPTMLHQMLLQPRPGLGLAAVGAPVLVLPPVVVHGRSLGPDLLHLLLFKGLDVALVHIISRFILHTLMTDINTLCIQKTINT